MGAKENFQNWVRTQARKRVQERKPCTQEWLEMQKRHFNKRNEIFDARIRRILTTASKKMNREALIRKLQQTTAFEMPKQKPNLGTIKNAEFVTEEEVGDLKKILSDIEKLKKIAVKAGREMSDLGDFETRFKGALLDDEAFLKAVKNWKSQRGIK